MDTIALREKLRDVREGTPLIVVPVVGGRWFGLYRGIEEQSENLLLGPRWDGDDPPYRTAFWEISVLEPALSAEHIERLIDMLPTGNMTIEGSTYTCVAVVPLMRAVGLVG